MILFPQHHTPYFTMCDTGVGLRLRMVVLATSVAHTTRHWRLNFPCPVSRHDYFTCTIVFMIFPTLQSSLGVSFLLLLAPARCIQNSELSPVHSLCTGLHTYLFPTTHVLSQVCVLIHAPAAIAVQNCTLDSFSNNSSFSTVFDSEE